MWKIFNQYDLTVTDIIRREKDLPLFQVEVGGDQALSVEGAELINRTQVGGTTSPLGSNERKTNIEGAELIIEILIRKLILWIALPTPTPWMKENTYTQEILSLGRDQQKTRLHVTLGSGLVPDCSG